MPLPPVPRSFYLRPTLTVARDLLGKLLVRRLGKEILVGRIVEVEAYLGLRDPASHAYRGMTPRNRVMFKEGGHLYVYFTYGMHFCCNVVTERAGIGRAVLLRAVEPLVGLRTMGRNRSMRILESKGQNVEIYKEVTRLTNGPAKLCQAMAIDRDENGVDLCHDRIWIANDPTHGHYVIARSARIGIREGTEHQWRFFIRGNSFVSRAVITNHLKSKKK